MLGNDEGAEVNFEFTGWEIDRVIQFFEDLKWLEQVTGGNFGVHGKLSGWPPLTAPDPPPEHMRVFEFDEWPTPQTKGYVRTLVINARELPTKTPCRELKVGGENAVIEDIALQRIEFSVSLPQRKRRSWKEWKRRLSDLPTWIEGFPTGRTSLLDDGYYQEYLLEYLRRKNKIFEGCERIFSSVAAKVATTVLSNEEARRLVRILEDFHGASAATTSGCTEAPSERSRRLLAEHYPTLGTHFRKHFSRCIKGVAKTLQNSDPDDIKLYNSVLRYLSLTREIPCFVEYEEIMNAWESIWFLDSGVLTSGTDSSLCSQILDEVECLLRRYKTLDAAKEEKLRFSHRHVLASVFVSLGRHMQPTNNGTEANKQVTRLTDCMDEALEIADEILRMAIYAAYGYLFGSKDYGVDRPILLEYVKLVADKLTTPSSDEQRVALKVLCLLLERIPHATSMTDDDRALLRPVLRRTVSVFNQGGALQPSAARILLELAGLGLLASKEELETELKKAVSKHNDSVPILGVAAVYEITADGEVAAALSDHSQDSWEHHYLQALQHILLAHKWSGRPAECFVYLSKADKVLKRCLEAIPEGEGQADVNRVSATKWSTQLQRYFAGKMLDLSERQNTAQIPTDLEKEYRMPRDLAAPDQKLLDCYLRAFHVVEGTAPAGRDDIAMIGAGCQSIAMAEATKCLERDDYTGFLRHLLMARPLGILGLNISIPWR